MRPVTSAFLVLLFLGGTLAGLPSADAWNQQTHRDFNQVISSRFNVDIDGSSQTLGSVPLHNPGSVTVNIRNFCAPIHSITIQGSNVGEVLSNHADDPDDFDPKITDGIAMCGKIDGVAMSAQWKHAYFLDPLVKNHEVGGLGWGAAPLMVDHFYNMAKQEFEIYYQDPVKNQVNATRGWLYMALASHYVQDMGVPYHAGFEVAGSVSGDVFTNSWIANEWWLDWWTGEGCKDVRSGHPGRWTMGGHLRFECGVFNAAYPNSPYLPQPGNVLSRNVNAPEYAKPEDYAIKLAEKSIDKGDSLSNAYFVMDFVPFMDGQGKELLDDTTLKLEEWTEEHTLGLMKHMAREFPDLQAGIPTVAGGAVTVPVTNPTTNVIKFLVRLLGNSCKAFTCSPTSVLIGEQFVTLGAFETKTVSFAVTTSQAAMELSTIIDGVPVVGEGCESLATGCIPEPVEILVDTVGIPPPAHYVGLADLAVLPDGVHYSPGTPTVVIDVANQGMLDAPAFDVQLYSRSASGSLTTLGSANVASGLPAGQSVSVPITFTGSMYRPLVRVDTVGTVQEFDESGNNQADIDATLINDRMEFVGAQSPPGDIWIGPGGDLVLNGATLNLRSGASLFVAPGGALHADHATIKPASSGGSYYFKSGGVVDLANSTVSGAIGGLRLQTGGSIVDSTLTSLVNYPAVTAVRGVVTLERNVFNGAGTGLVVAGGALVRSANNQYSGPGARAVEVSGGQFLSYDDTMQAAKTALLVISGGVAQLEGAILRPQVGLSPQTTLGIDVRNGGGTVVADDVTVTDATKGVLGSAGRVRFTGGRLDATTNIDGSGSFEVRATGLALGPGATNFAGNSWMRTEFPLDISAVSPAPDLEPLSGATLQLRDATGAAVWAGTTGSDGHAQVTVIEKVQRASGTTSSLPATLTALYNGPSVSTTLSGPVPSVQLAPPVLKDLAVSGLAILSAPAVDQAAISVANLESVTVPNVSVRLTRDGSLLATSSVGTLEPGETRVVHVALPPGAGTHRLTATVDPSNVVSEIDEANNQRSMDAWIVSSDETCTGPRSLDGTVVVKAPAKLDLASCQLSLGSPAGGAGVLVMPGATLRASGQSNLSSSSGFRIQSAGTLQVVDSVVDGVDSIQAEGGSVEFTRSRLTANAYVLHANNTAVAIRDSTLSAGNLTRGVVLSRGSAIVEDSLFKGFFGPSLRLEHLAAATLAGLTIRDAAIGVEFYNASVVLRDSVIEPTVSQTFTAIASHPVLVNVTQDVTRAHIGFESVVDIAWYATATVRGSDGQPVPGATVTVIDRAGTTVGQWTTDASGKTPRLQLLQRQLSDIDGDMRPLLANESLHSDPYTLQSMAKSSAMALPGNAAITLGQSYGTVLASTFPYATLPASGQTSLPIRVQNVGNGQDQLAFTVTAPAGWSASVAPASLDLASGALADLAVTVRAPATNNATAAFDVTATSEDGTTKSVFRLSAKTGPNLPPVPLFSFQPDATYVGDAVTFTDLSSDPDGWLTNGQWTFGDGTTAKGTPVQHAFQDSGDFVVTLAVTDNAGGVQTLQKTVHVFNRPPILEEGSVSPATSKVGDPITFRVEYRDIDGQPPRSAKVYVDGVGIPMTKMAASGGLALYTLQLSNLSAGQHRHRFEATDWQGATTLFPANFDLKGPFVDSAPVLSLLSVSPTTGTGSTLFTYRATYKDVDDDAPEFVRLSTAGATVTMAKAIGSQSYAQGVEYTASLTLNATGAQPFTVLASDGLVSASATAAGPTVTALSGLSNPSVTPDMGDASTTFEFKATYRDPGGVAPTSVTLTLDGVNRAMTGSGTNYASGVAYTAQVTGLASGAHSYSVSAVKGGTTIRLPASGALQGPVVNAKPIAQLSLEPSGTIATLFHADGTASSDAETPSNQLETRMDWGDGNATPWSKGRLHTHQYGRPGVYTTSFQVRDGHGAVSVATRAIDVASMAPVASFSVSPPSGDVEDGTGRGTTFLFRPGASGDVEDAWDTLTGRFDWEGDGTFDTPWMPITSQVAHKYTTPKTHTPVLEVRDSSGLVGTTTTHVKANGLRQLAMSVASADIIDFDGERHDYRLAVPENLVNLDVVLTFPAVAGVNYDLYVKRGSTPADLSNCNSACASSTSLGTGQAEEVCFRLPAAGVYFVTVVAESQLDGQGQQYQVKAQPDVKTAPVLLNCMVLG